MRTRALLSRLHRVAGRLKRPFHILTSGQGIQGLRAWRQETDAIRSIAPLVDEAWYLASYPDLADLDGGVAAHYYRHGAAEGRDPNPYFVTQWYLANRPDVEQSGVNPLLHYIRHGSQEGARPCPGFDPAWYRATYPDVGFANIEPLEHYVRYGAAEGRLTRATASPRRVVSARLRILKRPPPDEAVALFVTHAPGGKIKPHVPFYVAALRREKIAVTVIVATDFVEDVEVSTLEPLVEGLLVRSNEGFDFAAWAHAARIVDLSPTRLLVLANDSVVGPLDSATFSQIMGRIRAAREQIIGLTDNHELQPHLQSYFLAAKGEGVPALEDFLAQVVSIGTKQEVIRAYEVPLTTAMKQRGLKTAVLFPAPDEKNQTTTDWRGLLERGCPFVKTSALRAEGAEDWRVTIARGGYDPAIVDKSLAIIAAGEKPATELATPKPALVAAADDPAIAVPSGLSELALEQPGRVAIIAHIFHIDHAVEIRSILRNVPYACDVFLTTDDAEKKRRLEIVFAGWDGGAVEVSVTRNRGRDIAPKLLTWQRVYASYDYCLHLHTKESSHHSALKNWRDYLFLTLVGSPDIVRTIFGAFRAAPDLGIIAPQHYEPVRRWVNWGGNFRMAQTLARRMGVDVVEGAALDFPSGSMFWARCAALRPLLDLKLQLTDFDPETGQIDGTLAHAIERLYFISAEAAQMKWLKIGRPAYFGASAPFESVAGATALSTFLRQHAWRISEGHRKPSETPADDIDLPPAALIADAQNRALGTDAPPPNLRIMAGVVTYNNDAEQLARCLGSVRGAEQLFVWDNGASSAPAIISSLPLTHHHSKENIGFGAAHNRLMQQAFVAGADVYICLNPDGFLHPEAITRVARMIAARDGAALVECVQFPVDHPKSVDPTSLRTPWASGASLAIPKRVHDEIGGFDDGFFMYCEDVDLSWRARAQGFEVVLCPSAYFVHEVTNRKPSAHTLRMIAESGARLARKWRSPPFERWALGEGPGAKPPHSDVARVPEAWSDVADFDHGFSFSETRWS
ncbi:rhamnan synthesis F family protein [Bosea rubneri]|uniref:Rhamnan synthesis F family protein n=1 Tax=Bosea rubneri TaxID=3075434 RepID=A0ABU3SFS7_9HYPH|nr:rhamnan synthesis F family protein [Bosea sp. ZW T0_25]MDU0343594.1 rhamnan synthesis F family protein [Bosea sp. ZW T0_25]